MPEKHHEEKPLKKPKMPEVNVPNEFLDKLAETRANYEKYKKQIKQQKEDK